MMKNIKSCDRAVTMRFPVKRDDGTLEVIEAYKVQHSLYKKPCKGGRYKTDLLQFKDNPIQQDSVNSIQ